MEPQTLSRKKLVELIEKVEKEGKEEARFILFEKEINRQGPSCDIIRRVEVLYGDIEKVELEKGCQPYPGVCETKIALIPFSVPAIVVADYHDDCGDNEEHTVTVYVFTGSEWKSVQIDNLP